MHIHLPKPLHGWREFVGEVGIIVIGVLIALAAESLLERWHWHERTEQATEAIKSELLVTALYAWERQAVQPCLRGRIKLLAERLNAPGDAWTAAPSGLNGAPDYVMANVYRAPSRPLVSDAWRNAITSGTFSHLPGKRASDLTALYGNVTVFNSNQDQEEAAATRLTPLSVDRRLGGRDKLDLATSLAQVDRANGLLELVAADIVQQIHDLGLRFDKREVETQRLTTLKDQRAFRGACVRDLPLDLG